MLIIRRVYFINSANILEITKTFAVGAEYSTVSGTHCWAANPNKVAFTPTSSIDKYWRGFQVHVV